MKGGRNDLKVSYYLKRIINDKIKLGFIFLLFLLPIMDLISKLVSIHHGATPMTPWSSTFLSLTSTSFIFHSLFFNFLPLYLLIISCDDCFEDCTTKYRNILISKWGQKGLCNNKYYKIILHFLFPDTFYIAFKYAYVRNNFQYGDLQHIQRKFS